MSFPPADPLEPLSIHLKPPRTTPCPSPSFPVRRPQSLPPAPASLLTAREELFSQTVICQSHDADRCANFRERRAPLPCKVAMMHLG